jgi:hypothetical protein
MFLGDSIVQKLMQTTALLGVLVGLSISPAVTLAGELVVDDGPVFVPDAITATAPVTATAPAVVPYNAAEPTDEVIVDFNEAIAFCGAISSDEYVIDCLSERLDVIASQLPETGEFAEMRTAIADASAQLGAIAAQNPSATLPSGVARSADTATTRPLRPVATETLAASLQAADAIVAQTEVVLLRSSSNSQNRSLDFQRVAAVVGTSRSLLRSA